MPPLGAQVSTIAFLTSSPAVYAALLRQNRGPSCSSLHPSPSSLGGADAGNAVFALPPAPPPCRLALSASYDGELIVWDISAGTVLKRLSSKATRPDGREWPDPLPFTDGHFSPDGAGVAVTDVAGQLHYFRQAQVCSKLHSFCL